MLHPPPHRLQHPPHRVAASLVAQLRQSAPLAASQLGSCASSGRAWRLWAARYSQEEAGPLGAQPLPRVRELAASKAADSTAFDLQVEAFCNRIHRTLLGELKHALVWGSSVKHNPGVVGKTHVLNDEDVVQLIKKN